MDRGRLLSDTTDYSNRLTKGEALLENQAKKKMLRSGVGRPETGEKLCHPTHYLAWGACLKRSSLLPPFWTSRFIYLGDGRGLSLGRLWDHKFSLSTSIPVPVGNFYTPQSQKIQKQQQTGLLITRFLPRSQSVCLSSYPGFQEIWGSLHKERGTEGGRGNHIKQLP